MLHTSFTERVISNALCLISDDAGNAVSDYALIASSFAALMLGTMLLVQGAAAGQLSYTDNGLNNRNGVTP